MPNGSTSMPATGRCHCPIDSPSATAWLGQTIRQVRQYATGAREQLRNELGPEFDELRKPLEELRGLRNFNPRTAATQALFGDADRKSNLVFIRELANESHFLFLGFSRTAVSHEISRQREYVQTFR